MSVPLAAIQQSIRRSGYQRGLDVSGTVTSGLQRIPVRGSWQVSAAAYAVSATFNGQSALGSIDSIAGTVSGSGVAFPFASITESFVASDGTPLGLQSSVGYCVVTSFTAPSQMISPDAAGPIETLDCYTDASKTEFVAHEYVTYSTAIGTTPTNLSYSVIDVVTGTHIQQSMITTFLYDQSGSYVLRSIGLNQVQNGVTFELTGT